jgi:uncharacterized protein
VKSANAHFSNDLLSALLNEPIPGQGVFWSSVGGTPYPISLRVLSFERMYPLRDPDYNQPAAETYARRLRAEFEETLREAGGHVEGEREEELVADDGPAPADEGTRREDQVPGVDAIGVFETRAIEELRLSAELLGKIRDSGLAWGSVKAFFRERLPDTLEDRDSIAYRLVPKALNEIFGPQDEAWHSFRNVDRSNITYVRAGRNPNK